MPTNVGPEVQALAECALSDGLENGGVDDWLSGKRQLGNERSRNGTGLSGLHIGGKCGRAQARGNREASQKRLNGLLASPR